MRGWIPDTNRFTLDTPPAWWLTALINFDPMLVVLPSRFAKRYLLCRRRQFSAGFGAVALLDNEHPDTNMCAAHGVVPVAVMKFYGQWTLRILDELKKRDTWAISGGPTSTLADPEAGVNKLADHVEAFEAAQDAKQRADLRDNFYHRARDAWRSMHARIGSRNKSAYDGNRFAHRRKPSSGPRILVP